MPLKSHEYNLYSPYKDVGWRTSWLQGNIISTSLNIMLLVTRPDDCKLISFDDNVNRWMDNRLHIVLCVILLMSNVIHTKRAKSLEIVVNHLKYDI